jgi:hypothetical protein
MLLARVVYGIAAAVAAGGVLADPLANVRSARERVEVGKQWVELAREQRDPRTRRRSWSERRRA